MLPKGFSRNPRELPISSSRRYRPPRETRGDRGRMAEQSYDPIVPAKVGNRRALRGAATVPTGGKGVPVGTPRAREPSPRLRTRIRCPRNSPDYLPRLLERGGE